MQNTGFSCEQLGAPKGGVGNSKADHYTLSSQRKTRPSAAAARSGRKVSDSRTAKRRLR